MAYADAALQLQKAVVAKLKTDVIEVGGRVYDGVPPHAVKPYISLGPFQMLPEHGDCLDGGEAFLTIDAWSNVPGANGSSVEVKQIGAAIAKALDEAPLLLDAPQRLVDMSIEQIQYLRDPDGLTAHASITVHAWTEPTN